MQELLYLVPRIPFPPSHGRKARSYHMLEHLLKRYRVHIGTFIDDPADLRYADLVRRMCAESFICALRPLPARIASLSGFFLAQALTLPYYRDAAMQRWVDQLLRRRPIKHIMVRSSAMAQYVLHARGMHRVVDIEELEATKWRHFAPDLPWPLSAICQREAGRLLDLDRKVAREFDAAVLMSRSAAGIFRERAPESADKLWHVCDGVDGEARGRRSRPTLRHARYAGYSG